MARFLPAAAMMALLASCGGPQGGEPPPPEVEVQAVAPQSLPIQKELVGRLAAFRSADVRARVAGVLQRRVYQEGQDVKQGDVLFTIDPAPFQAALAQAQASLAQAEANYANARVAADRARQLAPQHYVSQSDLDNALAAERSTEAAVQAARAAVQAAQINLGYATVRAPISGRADKQQVTEGALVGQGAPTLLTTIDQIDSLYVNFSISVAEMDALRASGHNGQADVQVMLQDGSVYPHRGHLDFSADVVDPATGAVALRALLPNPDKRLLPGSYVSVRLNLGELAGVYVIPQKAVQRDHMGAYVLKVIEGEIKDETGQITHRGAISVRNNITLDRTDNGHWIVTSGLAAGDRIIVSGLQRADPSTDPRRPPSMPVTPRAADNAPAGAAPQAAQD